MQSMTPRLEVIHEHPYSGEQSSIDSRPASKSKRKLGLFIALFVLGCMASLAYVFIRSPVYQSTATLLIDPPANENIDEALNLQHVAVERQILISDAILSKVLDALTIAGDAATVLPSSLSELRSSLSAYPLGDTYMIELVAEALQPAISHGLVDTWIEVYQKTRTASQETSTDSTAAALRQQLQALEQKIADKRRALDRFRKQYDIVSMEREDNEILARLKGLNAALNEARQEKTSAAAQLAAIQESIARGQSVISPDDNSELLGLEREAKLLRGRLNAIERRFTPQYMAIDPDIVEMMEDLKRTEEQIAYIRRESQRNALAEAEQTLSGAERRVDTLESQLAAYRETAADFTARFAEHDALQQDLTQLEELHRQFQERLVQIEVANRDAYPEVTVLQPATFADSPVRPRYLRDAGIGVVGAGLLALLAVLIYDFFTRPVKRSTSASTWPPVYSFNTQVFPPAGGSALLSEQPALTLPRLDRELAETEVEALLETADDSGRLLIGALLSGLSIEEAAALRWQHVDLEAAALQAPDPSARILPLSDFLREGFARQSPHGKSEDTPVWQDENGVTLNADELTALITCAAHDAGLARPEEVTPQLLRHTYLAFLVRQGVRLSELKRVVGRLSPSALAAYGELSPPTPGVVLEQVERVFPVLKNFIAA